MTRSRPFGFLFSGRKRTDLPVDTMETPVEDALLRDPLAGTLTEDLISADDILTEDRSPMSEDTAPAPMIHIVHPATPPQERLPQSQKLRSPVFIVGSPRSGTSILTDGMLAAGYKGFREGNFLTLMRVFEVNADRHRKTFGSGSDKVMATCVDWDALKADIFAAFKRQVDALNPDEPWMDKTGNPEMIEAIPQLLKLWPHAVFILAKRRGIENVISRVKKFPGHSFEYHCRDWAKNMSAWHSVRELLGDRAIEIDQQEILRSTDQVAERLANLLGADIHAQNKIKHTFVTERPQQTGEGTAARVVSIETTGWSADQIEIFTRTCSAEMQRYGYSTRADYWDENFTPQMNKFG